MSDLAVPSWRPRPEKEAPSWRMLATAGGLLGAVAVAGAVTWGLSRTGPQTVPVIEADTRPLKVRPGNPGGLVVPNQDQLVLQPAEVRREVERRNGVARLGAGPESPQLDLLRQQVAPPPVAAVPPPVPAPMPEPPAAPGSAVAVVPPVAVPQAPPPVPAAAPPVAPVAEPAAAPGPVPNGRAMVQLGALASEGAARAEWDRLARRVPELAAFQPRILRLEREGQATLYRLRAAGLADGAAARALCDAVRAKGGACNPIGG